MATSKQSRPKAADGPTDVLPAVRNEVVLWGRVAAPAEERELPSGDSVVTARIIIERDSAARSRSAQRVDTIDCVGWTARVQRVMRRWSEGDRVEIEGAIRRRFFKGVAGSVSRVEVEVFTARKSKA
jgi:single-strand DNA-binding protein